MSDYRYYIVHKAPGRPRVGFWLAVRSFIRPIRGWTQGRGADWSGPVTSRRQWTVRNGRAINTGLIDHTCKRNCECVAGRQFASKES